MKNRTRVKIKFFAAGICFLFSASSVLANILPTKDTIPVSGNNFVLSDSALDKAFRKPASVSFYSLFNPNKKFLKRTSISSVTDLSILQQDISYKTQAAITTQYTVGDTLNHECRFDVSITKLKTQVETMGLQLQYNSQDSAQDTTSLFTKSLSEIVGKNFYLKVDTNGIIQSIDTSDTGEKLSAILSMLSVSGNDFQAGSDFGLALNPKVDSLSSGDSWSDSVVFFNGSKRLITYTVQSLLNNEIVLIISGTVAQKGFLLSGGRSYTTDFSGTQAGKIVAIKNTRLVKSRSITYTLKGTVQADGKEYPASAVSKIDEKIISE